MGCGGAAGNGTPSRPEQLVLHPRDLPRGYQYGDDTYCGRIYSTEGDWPKLQPLFAAERPNACSSQLEWIWTKAPRYSNAVTSAAYVFADASGASRAYEARDELAMYTATLDVKTRHKLELGDGGELLSGRGLNNPASGAVWRHDNVVAVLVVEPAMEGSTRELAEKQETRIERPPRPTAMANDPELPLDDPALKLPVYWLGRSFDPRGELPRLELELASFGGNGPGQSIQLWYAGGATFDTWERSAWNRFRRSRLGRLVWDSPCARKETVRVDGGRAEIFHGYGEPTPVERPCPQRRRDRVVGHVYYEDVVVAVNMPYCYMCARPLTSNPYNTVEAMELLVRSLRLRTQRH